MEESSIGENKEGSGCRDEEDGESEAHPRDDDGCPKRELVEVVVALECRSCNRTSHQEEHG